jgi:uncharacterized protein YqeY
MKYDLIVNVDGEEYTVPKIYKENELEWLIETAKQRHGKVKERETGKIIYNFCTCPEGDIDFILKEKLRK